MYKQQLPIYSQRLPIIYITVAIAITEVTCKHFLAGTYHRDRVRFNFCSCYCVIIA